MAVRWADVDVNTFSSPFWHLLSPLGSQALCSCPSLIKTASGKALKSPLTEQ